MIGTLFTLLLAVQTAAPAKALALPDVVVTTESGARVPFDQLVRGRVVAMNFIFTSCTTVCPVMGTHFARTQSLLGDRAKDVLFLSVSIDPVNDTPKRLAAWSKQMGGRDGWTLVTGAKPDIDRILDAVGAGTGSPAAHSPLVLAGDDRTGSWERLDGLGDPQKLASVLEELLKKRASPAKEYFSDVKLVDQDGKAVDLYSLIKDRTVVMNSFFATCTGSCPVMSGTFGLIQKEFGDRLGKDLVLISISVDPENDTPPKLKAYAEKMKARPGWYFLTGSREQVDFALRKIGQHTPEREAHTNIFIIGNDRTGLWKKALGLAQSVELARIVEGVLNDGT